MPSRSSRASSTAGRRSTAISGCVAWKRARRGTSQRAANAGRALTTRREGPPAGAPLERRLEKPQALPHLRRQRLPLLRQEHVATLAPKQPGTEAVLETAYGVADGSVREVQLLGGAAVALAARGSLEGDDGLQWRQAGRHVQLVNAAHIVG
jgi:hypothetical protein